jgi:hypothetical protein
MYGFLHEDPAVYFKMLFGADDPSLRPYYRQLIEWDNRDYFYNDSHTIVRINALLRLVSFGLYNVHVIFFSFFSLTGLACLFKTFAHFLPHREKALLIAVFLTPSVLFWSSGILKEGLLLFGLGVLFYSKLQLIHAGKKYYAVPALAALVVLLLLKVYVLLLLFPALVAWMWSSRSPVALTVLKFAVVYGLAGLLLLAARWINPNLKAESVIYWKRVASVKLAAVSESRSKIDPPKLENRFGSLVAHAPAAFACALVQPTPAQAHNPFAALAAAENMLLLLFLAVSLLAARKPTPEVFVPVLACAIFSVLLLILVGYTTATAGNLVRYKMPALPFLLFVGLALFDAEMLKKRLGIRKTR